RTLAIHTPAVACKRAVHAHDPVTWNRNGDCVRCAGLRDRSHRLRLAQALCKLGVGCGRACWDRANGIPHAALKRRAADVEREVKPATRGLLDKADDLRDLLLKRTV